MAVIGDRQGLAALVTALFQWDESSLVRRFRTRSSSSHALSPPGFITRFLLLGYTPLQPQFAIQRKKRATQLSNHTHLQHIAADGYWAQSAYLRGRSGLRLLAADQTVAGKRSRRKYVFPVIVHGDG